MSGCPLGSGMPRGAFRTAQGHCGPSLLVSSAQTIEVMIRPVLAICHLLPSLREEGFILSEELTQHPGTAGKEGTHYMMALMNCEESKSG